MKSRVRFCFVFFFLLTKVEWALQLMKFNEYGPQFLNSFLPRYFLIVYIEPAVTY